MNTDSIRRGEVRSMTRAIRAANGVPGDDEGHVLAKEFSLSLLARSIDFGHRRLAVIRLFMAVQAGAEVPHEHWIYCRQAAAALPDDSVKDLFLQAAAAAPAASLH